MFTTSVNAFQERPHGTVCVGAGFLQGGSSSRSTDPSKPKAPARCAARPGIIAGEHSPWRQGPCQRIPVSNSRPTASGRRDRPSHSSTGSVVRAGGHRRPARCAVACGHRSDVGAGFGQPSTAPAGVPPELQSWALPFRQMAVTFRIHSTIRGQRLDARSGEGSAPIHCRRCHDSGRPSGPRTSYDVM